MIDQSDLQTELVEELVDSPLLLRPGDGRRETDLGGEHERLEDCEHGEELVVLHHVGRRPLHIAGTHLVHYIQIS